MNAQDALRAGQIDDALGQLQGEVRRRPSDARLRIFLFQLLCIRGEWDRALTQLTVAGELDAAALLMVQTYREALRCEVYRAAVFSGRQSPMFLGEPDEWLAPLVQSLSMQAEGRSEDAARMREMAFAAAAASSGTVNDEPFEWMADGDGRLGPCLELIVSGRYYWVPFSRIHTIAIEAPTDLRDFVWLPANLTWTNGGEAVALIPTRYPGSENSDDVSVRLARSTEWQQQAENSYFGLGQRTFITDSGETALLDVRKIEFTPVAG